MIEIIIPPKKENRLYEIGSFIREYRFAIGLTQKQLGELSGLNRNTIVRIENSQNISVQNLIKIADALQVDLNQLFAGMT